MHHNILFAIATLIAICLSDPGVTSTNSTIKAFLGCGIDFALTEENINYLQQFVEPTISPEAFDSSFLFDFKNMGGPQPWPRGSDKKVTIPYCYWRPEDRNAVNFRFVIAYQTWESELGGEASKASGHGVVFKEHTDKSGNPVYCYAPNSLHWNPILPVNTLAIAYFGPSPNPGQAAGATVGFLEHGTVPWLNQLLVYQDFKIDVLIHELGHVLGMTHEHQRNDRDDHIKIRCEKLVGFDTAWNKVKNEPGRKKQDLCDNIDIAARAGFIGTQIYKGYVVANRRPWTVQSGSAYDVDSIMHYSSQQTSGPECWSQEGAPGLDNCGIVKYRNLAKHDEGVALIPPVIRPSSLDVQWVKATYPWQD